MKRLLLAIAALIAMTASGAAAARVDMDTSLSGPDIIVDGPEAILDGPDVILDGPDYYYYAPGRHAGRPRVVILPEYIYQSTPAYRSHFYRENYRWQPEYRKYAPPPFGAPQPFRRPHPFGGHLSHHPGWHH